MSPLRIAGIAKRGAALLVLAVLLAALFPPNAAGWPTASSGPFESRGAISITSDAGFTAANGVRSGTGSPGDPYVISGWYITSAPAITVKGVTKSFLIRDNRLEVTGTGWAVNIEDVQVPNYVVNNQIKFSTGGGVQVKTSDTLVRDNQIIGGSWNYASGVGVSLHTSNSVVAENVFTQLALGIKTRGGSPQISGNNIGIAGNGILVENTGPGLNVSGNIVANAHGYGIWLNTGSNATIYGNLIEQVKVGIEVWACVAVDVRANYVHDHMKAGVIFESCNGTASYNLVFDGKAGFQLWQSDVVMHNNTVYNHIAIGVEWMMSEGIMADNHIELNGLGLKLQDMGVVRLRRNVFLDNTVGVDIPYVARQSVPHMQGNFVNGLNIDGTVVPSQKAYYYKAANVVVAGATFDSGFGAGRYGSATAQGGLTLYEVNTARISASTFSHNTIGLHVVNSFDVQVSASVFVNNLVGINITTANSMGQPVPKCVGSVKNTTIIIEVDPPATYGIRNQGCRMEIHSVSISGMDVGIYFDAQATGVIATSDVFRTSAIGIRLDGTSNQPTDAVLAHENHLWANRIAVLLRGSGSDWKRNVVNDNAREGMRLEGGAHPVLVANNFTRNLEGVFDACESPGISCSEIVSAERNVYFRNSGHGLLVLDGATIVGDHFVANGGPGFRLKGDNVVKDVRAQGNGGSGGDVGGYSVVRGSSFRGNAAHGLVAHGTITLVDSAFTSNTQAGIRSDANWLTGLRLTVAKNHDGMIIDSGSPTIGVPSTPYPWIQPGALLYGDAPDGGVGALVGSQVFVHRSKFVDNERNAIRAGVSAVNATYNYWGNVNGPTIDTGVTGTFGNSISPTVHFLPYYRDEPLTTTGPLAGL